MIFFIEQHFYKHIAQTPRTKAFSKSLQSQCTERNSLVNLPTLKKNIMLTH